MITLTKAVFLGVTALTLCTVSLAQTAQVHGVRVLAESHDSAQVVSAVKAKIGGTLRYQLRDDAEDLWIDILCFKIKSAVGDTVTGTACAVTYLFHPETLGGADILLDTSLNSGSEDGVGIAQSIFETFVRYTSDSELAKKKAEIIRHIRYACGEHADKKDEVTLACAGLAR